MTKLTKSEVLAIVSKPYLETAQSLIELRNSAVAHPDDYISPEAYQEVLASLDRLIADTDERNTWAFNLLREKQ